MLGIHGNVKLFTHKLFWIQDSVFRTINLERETYLLEPYISARVSLLVLSSLLKEPLTAEVTVMAFGFFTPRMDMHRCSASITTITPFGERPSMIASATWVVSRS